MIRSSHASSILSQSRRSCRIHSWRRNLIYLRLHLLIFFNTISVWTRLKEKVILHLFIWRCLWLSSSNIWCTLFNRQIRWYSAKILLRPYHIGHASLSIMGLNSSSNQCRALCLSNNSVWARHRLSMLELFHSHICDFLRGAHSMAWNCSLCARSLLIIVSFIAAKCQINSSCNLLLILFIIFKLLIYLTYLCFWALAMKNPCPFVVFLLLEIWLPSTMLHFPLVLWSCARSVLWLFIFLWWTRWVKANFLLISVVLVKSSCGIIQCFSWVNGLPSYNSTHDCSLLVLMKVTLDTFLTIYLLIIHCLGIVDPVGSACSEMARAIIVIITLLNVHVYFFHIATCTTSGWRMQSRPRKIQYRCRYVHVLSILWWLTQDVSLESFFTVGCNTLAYKIWFIHL